MDSVGYEAFLILLKGRDGSPRGIEKTWNDTLFYSREDAEEQLSRLPDNVQRSYKVVCIHILYCEG